MWDKNRKDMFEEMFEDINRIIKGMMGKNFDIREGEPLVWGFSMTQSGDEPPQIHEFGNLNLSSSMKAPEMEPGAKKPLVDVLEADEALHIVVEMPGIEKEDINLKCNGTSLDIRAKHGDREYSEHVELPRRVLPDTSKATFKNGVLEVVFKYDPADNFSIKID